MALKFFACSPHTKAFEEGSERVCKDCEQKESLMKELKEFKNRTAKQREDYESKYTVLKKELGQMEDVLLEENVASKDNTKDDDDE